MLYLLLFTTPATGVFDPVSLYQENSQQSFDPGGTRFSHNVGNIDINRVLSDKVSIGMGAEFRNETFEVIEGELASYDGGGADSFSGNTLKILVNSTVTTLVVTSL